MSNKYRNRPDFSPDPGPSMTNTGPNGFQARARLASSTVYRPIAQRSKIHLRTNHLLGIKLLIHNPDRIPRVRTTRYVSVSMYSI